ncbi:translation initiation factor IF-2 [Lates calcarifer]|uniref:Translation initiation factor IF-2 n=1 Tax=Lates calcarifer TaxID=8187 RepID=A0AAJ7QE86_LATCA|nr:translation initiation factor IF-2 [Lates calcarifer]
MGCSTSSQTSAVDTTRPGAKPEESNGASTTGAANENGKVGEDSETLPDQTPPGDGDAKPAAGEPAAAATPADSAAAAPPAGGGASACGRQSTCSRGSAAGSRQHY